MPTLKLAQRMTTFVMSLALALGLGSLFYLFKLQDANSLQQALSNYQQQSLLTQEQTLYLDFTQRRLRVEQIGTPDYLRQLEAAIKMQSSNDVAKLILMDRFFYHYLVDEGQLFMKPSAHQHWQAKRDQFVEPVLASLSERKFGLRPEQFGASNLVSYLVVEAHNLRLAANLMLLLLLGAYLEPRIGKGKMLLLFIGSALASALSYVAMASVFDNHNEQILQSASGAVSGITGMTLATGMHSLRAAHQDGVASTAKKLKIAGLLAIVMLVSLKTAGEWWFGWIEWKAIASYGFALSAGVILHFIFRPASASYMAQSRNESAGDSDQSWLFRVALSEVMSAISIMDFNAARDKLAALMKRYPDSIQLIEQRYHLEKLQSDGEIYWDCVRELVDLSVKKKDYYRMKALFEDIQKNAASKRHAKARLAPEYYHKMMMVFVMHDDLNKAEQAFLFLELAGHSHIINDACLLLQQEFKTRGNIVKERQYQMLRERL